ncbi:MAG: hypothetical protein NC191_03330 [Muribaculaceae bacterium]|nr:hypothetical protein [Muribaculaceae bacterium]
MIIQKINVYNYNNNYNKNNISFQSHRERELTLKQLQEIEKRRQQEVEKRKKLLLLQQQEEEKRRQEMLQRKQQEREREINGLRNLAKYEIEDSGCQDMAQFLLNFSCAIENDSEHSLDEFFRPKEEAEKLRENLSSECRENSLELRKEIQSNSVFNDPVLTLITARNMQDYTPVDEEFTALEEYRSTINSAKKAIINIVDTTDKTKFNSSEINLMKELTQIIEKTEGLVFGEEYDEILNRLLNSLNSPDEEEKEQQPVIKQRSFISRIMNKIKLK